MTDWIEHNGGPQPVADDVWVEVLYSGSAAKRIARAGNHMSLVWKGERFKWRIVNQNTMTSLIDAARLEGIRLGLEAAARLAEEESGNLSTTARVLQGFHSQSSATVLLTDKGIGSAIRNLNPDTIAREAQDMRSDTSASTTA